MFEFSGRTQQAGLETVAGRIRPAGCTLETPVPAYASTNSNNQQLGVRDVHVKTMSEIFIDYQAGGNVQYLVYITSTLVNSSII